MKLLPIVFTCDDHYFKYTCVVICSILENSDPGTKYEINILSEFISDENKKLAEKMISSNSNFSINYHIIKIENPEKYHLNSYMSLSTYYRFFLFDLLKNYKRVLYLDSDLIIENDISFFTDIDFEDKTAVCSPSVFVQRVMRENLQHSFTSEYLSKKLLIEDYNNYFNAGVILFNLEKIIAEGIEDKLFESIGKIKNPIFQDQDILNAVLNNNGGVKMISSEYNYTKMTKMTCKRILLNAVCKKAGLRQRNEWFTIYHFVGKEKPWQRYNRDSSLFYYYAFKTPFLKLILASNNIRFDTYLKSKYGLVSRF